MLSSNFIKVMLVCYYFSTNITWTLELKKIKSVMSCNLLSTPQCPLCMHMYMLAIYLVKTTYSCISWLWNIASDTKVV